MPNKYTFREGVERGHPKTTQLPVLIGEEADLEEINDLSSILKLIVVSAKIRSKSPILFPVL